MGNYIVKFCSCQDKNETSNTPTEFKLVMIIVNQSKSNQKDIIKDEVKTSIEEPKLTPIEVESTNIRIFLKSQKKEHHQKPISMVTSIQIKPMHILIIEIMY